MFKKKIFLSLVLLAVGTAFAEGGFYTGIGAGYANVTSAAQGALTNGAGTSQNASAGGVASNLYFGYDFNHFVGLQEEYDIAYSTNIGNTSVNQQIFGTSLLLHLPFSVFSNSLSGLSVFAKGGMAYEIAGLGANSSCANCVNPASQNAAFTPIYGLGAEYGFTNVGYRLEWDGVAPIMNTNNGANQTNVSSNMFLLSIDYHF